MPTSSLLAKILLASLAFSPLFFPALAQSLRNGDFEFSVQNNTIRLRDASRNEDLFRIPHARFMLPSFAASASLRSASLHGDSISLEYSDPSLLRGSVDIKSTPHGFLARASFTPSKPVQVNRLHIVSTNTHSLMWSVDNFRNRHRTHAVTPELQLGNQIETSTFSDDWQFAPHPSLLVFNRAGRRLAIGATEAPLGGYGLRLKANRHKILEFFLEYGAALWGWQVAANEEWTSPEFLFSYSPDPTSDVFAAFSRFGDSLVSLGKIPSPQSRQYFPWHREHVYCSWLDQCNAAKFVPETSLRDQALAGTKAVRAKKGPQAMLDESFVRQIAAKIKRENLPIRTILLDAGWSIDEISATAHPDRFPDMRKLVDDLHAMGFKVCAWWLWSEVRREEVRQRFKPEWLAAGGKRNHLNMWVPDYSKKSTRDEFLKPLIRRMFSSEPGCYNFDGIKTDYMADKVHPDMPAEDPSWRGEENYFVKLYSFFFSEMRKFKPDAMHVGCSGNYFLAEYIDVNRTFDVWTDDWLEHENRAKMCIATAPGVSPVYDMHMYRLNLSEFLDSARRLNVPVHVSSLNLIVPEFNAAPVPATPADFQIWRTGLAR